jgi:hypothetical protein
LHFDENTLRLAASGKKIAIVGNARSLLESSQGAAIDACDIVVRLNAAPGCQPASHGSKTTWLACSIPVPVARLRQLRPELILYMTPKHRWRAVHLKLLGWKLAYYPKPWWQELSSKLDGARPSTGIMAVDLMCRTGSFTELKLFGFDFFQSGSLSGRSAAAPRSHDFQKEGEVMASLAATDHRITIVTPSPRWQLALPIKLP